MRHIVKWLFFIAVLGFLGLVAYTYVGPFFGVKFAPPPQEIRKTVILNEE